MTRPPTRVFLPALIFAALTAAAFAVMYAQFRGLSEQLHEARQDSQTLAQQLRDHNIVPNVTPQPGPTGAAGSPGTPGQPGSSGPSGSNGRAGQNGASGKPGAAGVSGAPGASGAPGVKGDTGPQGDKGDMGEQGPKGDPGSPGPTCPDGYHATHTTVVTQGGPQDAVICTAD